MEIMEEGNLMDRVRILLQRDQAFYNENQKVLQDKVCSTVVGGALDFPCIASFVGTKLVTWWEESYYLLFRSLSAIFQDTSAVNFDTEEEDNISLSKSITSKDFVTLISQCCTKLIEHLHVLSQEALDHADLSVLTGTIGTTALVRNTIWIYNQQLIEMNSGVSLSDELKTFEDLSEALAERLLDLHNRLIALYILQDVDCLNWNAEYPFFEGERSSYTIQMWWLYVQGTQEDLWNTMPPKTAERIFSGILNDSLTIFNSRYMTAKAGYARSALVIADISNILLCMFQLLPTISVNADELLGCHVTSNIMRDIHVKCHLLFCYFILRGTPLSVLYKNFKDGYTNASCLSEKQPHTVEPWVIFATSERNEEISIGLPTNDSLPLNLAIKYELLVLLSRAQPIWPLLIKIARMSDCWILHEILRYVIIDIDETENEFNTQQCNGFLCRDECSITSSIQNSVVYILLALGNKISIEKTLIKVLEEIPHKWAIYFSHSQIWNQNRPLWIQTILSLIQPVIKYVIKIISQNKIENESVNDIVTKYIENMTLIVECLPEGVIIAATLIENILPPDIIPAGDSVLIQLMITSLYDELGNESPIAEALCRIDSKQFKLFQKSVRDANDDLIPNLSYVYDDDVDKLLADHIFKEKSGRASLKVLYSYLKNHADWLKIKLGITPSASIKKTLLYKMFYIGDNAYDQVLSGSWMPKWSMLLNMPLELTTENIQNQLSMRSEFWQNRNLSNHDQMIVSHLKTLFVPVIKCVP